VKTKFQKAWPCVVAGAPYTAEDNSYFGELDIQIYDKDHERVAELGDFALARCIVKLLNRECGK
jgi:hypothetical protein